jgi:hypothetical protein
MLFSRAPILGPVAILALGLGLGITGTAAAGAAQASPGCAPASLNNSLLQDSSVTISPLAGSRDVSAHAQISFLGVPAAAIVAVSVVGTQSGVHTGHLAAYSQGDGASFLPARPFAEGERVTVRARLQLGGRSSPLLDQFVIARENHISSTPERIFAGRASEAQSFRSRPDLHPPVVRVTASSPAAAHGDVFVAPYSGPGQAGPMILDQQGQAVWFAPLPVRTSAANFRVQQFQGRPVLSWWQGDISEHGFGLGEDIIEDSSYTRVARVRAANGLRADLHEFQLTSSGTALITAYHPIECDLSALGGQAQGAVTDGVLQEIDVATGLVKLEWTSLDHVGLAESYESARKASTRWPFDFFHINSINVDPDGGLLVSARNTWAVYDIDARSGKVLWRLGGRHSSFTQAPGTRTAFQHDPRVLADGSISIFDNGASPTVRPQSRGIVLGIDPQARTATLLRQITHGPPLLAESQGNMQALEHGAWFLGWGQLPNFSEYGPAGELLFDAHFPRHTQSYRSFRFAWTGVPAEPPRFSLAPGAGGTVAYASWNGATELAAWRVLAGASPTTLRVLAQAQRSGFETAIPLPAGTVGPYVAVQALGSSGQLLGASAAVAETALRSTGGASS